MAGANQERNAGLARAYSGQCTDAAVEMGVALVAQVLDVPATRR